MSRPSDSLREKQPSITFLSVTKRDSHEFFERFSTVLKRVRGLAADTYAQIEIGTAQAKILRHIGRNALLSQADLARATDTAPTLTGRALETLIERGWVRRKRSKEDKRQYMLELTASGQRMRERVDEARDQFIQKIGGALDDKDVEDFDRIAKKVLAVIDAESKEGASR